MRSYRIREIQSQPVITIAWDQNILAASGLMQSANIRRLPVVDDENVVIGIVSLGDVREAMSVYNTASPYAPDADEVLLAVDEIMSSPAITVRPDDTVLHAVKLMLEHKIGGLPVVDEEGHAVGMVTETDIFRLLVRLWEEGESEEATGADRDTGA